MLENSHILNISQKQRSITMMLTTRQMFTQFVILMLFGLINVTKVGAEPAGADAQAPENRPAIAAWLAVAGPINHWKAIHGDDPFPVEKIIQEVVQAQGLTDILFFMQAGRGGQVYYSTKHPVLKAYQQRMGDRDYTEEWLAACDRVGVRVWLAYTPPPGNKPYPGTTDVQGLNDPRMIKLYCEMIDEVAALYGHHKSLAGFLPHEVNCAEVPDNHEDDQAEFSEFCEKEFGEPFQGEVWPPEEDAGDINWRRYFLYRIHVMTTFIEATAKTAAKHNLKTMFCLYVPESDASQSWRWGYDPVQLEAICENAWAPMTGEYNKSYQNMRGVYLDIGLSYRGMNYSKSYSYAFHGYPLAYFEMRSPNYVEETRAFYRKAYKNDAYDFFLDRGASAREVDLFLGKTMVSRWLGLIGDWHGGVSPARVAVATASVPFIMQHPFSPGTAYAARVTELMESLTECMDVDGILLESAWALDPANLRQYKLIIIPEDMGAGLSAAMAQTLKTYLRDGGQLLVIASPLYQSRRDLTQQSDLTEELCGARIEKTGTGGFVQPVGEGCPGDIKKFWADRLLRVTPSAGVVEIKDEISGRPLLIRRGNAALATLSFNKDSQALFKNLVTRFVQPPVRLESDSTAKTPSPRPLETKIGRVGAQVHFSSDNQNLRLLETVVKDNALCLTFFNPGKAVLRIDAAGAGLTGDKFEVRNIITGVVLHTGDAASLAAGVPFEIKHHNQPLVLAVGAPERLAGFTGIVPADEEFAGLAEFKGAENPQVPVYVPDKPGIKVGVYHSGKAAKELLEALNRESDINAFILPRMASDALSKCDVFILPQSGGTGYIKAGIPGLTNWVANGGGALLLHGVLDWPIFPEVGTSEGKMRFSATTRRHCVRPETPHPITAGMSTNDWFEPSFQFDHIILKPGPGGTVAIVDDGGAPVVVAGPVGKGRAALNGMLPGVVGARDDAAGRNLQAPTGAELDLLLNTVRWLAGDKPSVKQP
jgi:hypothetical protein